MRIQLLKDVVLNDQGSQDQESSYVTCVVNHARHQLEAVQLGVLVRVHHLEVVEEQLLGGHGRRVQAWDLQVLLHVPQCGVDVIGMYKLFLLYLQ